MSKLLVMTDLHLTPGDEKIIGLDPLIRLKDGLDHAARMHPDADRIVLMGDLTHHGDEESYEKLKAALVECPWPVSYLLGNHDHRQTFLAAFPDCRTDAHGFVQAAVELDDIRLITLDTLDEEATVEHSGRLCIERLAWLEQALQQSEKPCLLFMHHPPFRTGFRGMDEIRLLNDKAFRQVIHNRQVRHIFAGHIHRTINASVAGIPATTFKSTCHQMPMLLRAEGSSHSVDEPGAYGVVIVDGPDVIVHFEDFTLPDQATVAY